MKAKTGYGPLLISLRKHIDDYDSTRAEAKTVESDISDEALAEFRAMLLVIGRCGARAVPNVGDLNQKMTDLEGALTRSRGSGAVSKTRHEAQAELSDWAERAFARHQEVEREVREIVTVISTAAESVGQRDARYVDELGELSGRLGSIAMGTDLGHMRQSIVESTRALKICVDQMKQESRTLVDGLTAEVKEYRARLEESERISNTDPLTGIANRRAFEKEMDSRIQRGKPFSLITIDLDDFKGVNDRYGHPAGDNLLRQFADELKALFPPGDLVARLGGDEFIIVTGGGLEETLSKVERVRTWALGEYKVPCAGTVAKVQVRASIGAGEWKEGESVSDFVRRVDDEVYRAKAPRERRAGGGS